MAAAAPAPNRWGSAFARNQMAFWASLWGAPHEYNPAAGGVATWYGTRLLNATFLGRPVPFTKLSVYDSDINPIAAQVVVYLDSQAIQNINDANLTITYAPETHLLQVRCPTAWELVTYLSIAQRLQSGAISWNVAAGIALDSRQKTVRRDGQINLDDVRDLYQNWYDAWRARTQPATSTDGGISARERFELGLRNPQQFYNTLKSHFIDALGAGKEQLSGTSNLVADQMQFDRMAPE